MKLFWRFTAEKLGTKRHSLDPVTAQQRDNQLFVDHFLDGNYKELGLIKADNYLSEATNIKKLLAEIVEQKATVLVAYLSCIGSNADEISKTIDMLNGDIMVAELPHATAEELKVYAKLEDSKKKFMGIRSKAGIALAKIQGQNIGGLRGKTQELNSARKSEADRNAKELEDYFIYCRNKAYTLQETADYLNEKGAKTAQGKEFKPMTVKRYLSRLD